MIDLLVELIKDSHFGVRLTNLLENVFGIDTSHCWGHVRSFLFQDFNGIIDSNQRINE